MKLRISSKMLAGFLLMTGLLLVGGAMTIIYTYRLQGVTTELLMKNFTDLKAARELEMALFRMRGLTFNYALDGEQRWLDNLENWKREFISWLNDAQETAHSGEEKALLQSISTLFAQYESDLQQAVTLNRADQPTAARRLLLHASRDVFDSIYEKCELYVAINENAVFGIEAKIQQANKFVRIAMYWLMIVGMTLGGFLGVMISRSIINPIHELVLKVRGATGGELVERVKLKHDTEIDELDFQVHKLINRINTTMHDLEKNRRLLARAERLAALGRMAAGVAHEIRNPLTSIKMLMYSLQESLIRDGEKHEELDVIVKEINRIEGFITNFLQFARPPDPNYASRKINEIIRETLMLLDSRLRQNGVELVELYDESLAPILVDADQVKQVIMNLVLNAAESMPNGGRLTIQTRQAARSLPEHNHDWIQIKIADTGSGIPENIKDSLFDPFVSGRAEGIGLGLSIVHQIVHNHSGWIEAQNNPQGGATFSIHFPDKRG
ncbi:MCP four helix bundle domain-containing protein [candidate division KSB1 bacterium]|nr:MCP four helix bundle domain-containing protein [candidate division KSB1 bacterium]